MKTYTVTITDLDGDDPKLDGLGAALLYGVTVDQIKAIAPGPIPDAWVKASRRRANEALAATGGDDLLDILEYWARKDYDAELVLVGRPTLLPPPPPRRRPRPGEQGRP